MIGRRPAHDLCPDCEGAASGPFETEAQARAAAQHITATPPCTGVWQSGSHRLLCEALTATGGASRAPTTTASCNGWPGGSHPPWPWSPGSSRGRTRREVSHEPQAR